VPFGVGLDVGDTVIIPVGVEVGPGVTNTVGVSV